MRHIEVTGKTEEEAISRALSQLGLDRDEVSVEILERAKSGFLGIGSSPAKIRVTYGAEEEVEAEKPQTAPVIEKTSAPAAKEEQACACSACADETADEKADKIRAFLSGLLKQMDSNAVAKVCLDSESGRYRVILEGDHLGQLIGRRGETLDAIQQLTNYAVNHGSDKRIRVQLDAENYREKREESLKHLAEKMAGKVIKYRRDMTLEPMNAYERHVIHSALQDDPRVTTQSIGTDPNRRVVVKYQPTR